MEDFYFLSWDENLWLNCFTRHQSSNLQLQITNNQFLSC